MRDLERADCLAGACLVHSQWEGYLNEPNWQEVNDWCKRHGIPLHQIHVSGHATQEDLMGFAKALSPRILVPIHSAHPKNMQMLYSNVECHPDGEWWNI